MRNATPQDKVEECDKKGVLREEQPVGHVAATVRMLVGCGKIAAVGAVAAGFDQMHSVGFAASVATPAAVAAVAVAVADVAVAVVGFDVVEVVVVVMIVIAVENGDCKAAVGGDAAVLFRLVSQSKQKIPLSNYLHYPADLEHSRQGDSRGRCLRSGHQRLLR